MNRVKRTHNRSGVVLLVILFIVMTVTVVSLGFIARSDVELSCGVNMALKSQMDYLAQSGLEHARGIILNPQDAGTAEYWTGGTGLQLDSSSSDYYDVSVSRTSNCNYVIESQAYRSKDGQQTGSSKLRAKLRLDPCIALRTGGGWTSEPGLIVNGDVYTNGYLAGDATIKGDAFAEGDIYATVNITGSENELETESVETIPFPAIDCGKFKPSYYIGSDSYSPYIISNFVPLTCVSYTSSVSNPKGVCYCNGSLVLGNSANIYGTLVVNGNLIINGTNVIISAKKNFPALIVTGKLKLVSNSHCVISGLVQINDEIEGINSFGVEGATSVTFTVNGSVFIKNNDIDGLSSATNTLRINTDPDRTAIELWNSSGTPSRWNCTGGAFYKSIERY